MKTPNLPLLRKAVEWAETEAAKPEGGAWLQREWKLNVDSLLEGYTSTESRERFEDSLLEQGVSPACGTAYCIAGYVGQLLEPGYEKHEFFDGVHVADFAREALGISQRQADLLFTGSNGIEDVRQHAEEIAQSVGEHL